MKRLRLQGYSSTSHLTSSQLSFHCSIPFSQRCYRIRQSSSQAAVASTISPSSYSSPKAPPLFIDEAAPLEKLRSPPLNRAFQSAKLAALHARLSLASSFPLQSLARTLVDVTADPNSRRNNASLAIVGEDLLGYYCSEHLICHYPRLPIEVLWAAQRAYVGPEALATITREWGVEPVAAPGGEVDPGYLQYQPKINTELHYEPGYHAQKREADREAALPESLRRKGESEDAPANWKPQATRERITNTYRIMSGDQFGLQRPDVNQTLEHNTLENASSSFVRALFGATHLHGGSEVSKSFFKNHFLSRSLNMSTLFSFERPHRDLLLLCKREGFEPPVARLISETGRKSAHPVFVIGVFSGRDKLGEGVGGSLNEAKTRATVAALKGWYLYSPMEVTCPSETETVEGRKPWKPNMVDYGEVVVY